jgi:cytochrome c553
MPASAAAVATQGVFGPRRLRAGQAVRLGLALLFLGAAAARALEVPDTLAQRVQACVVCHGKEGRASNQGYLPRIAGKPAGYLYAQLINFREGRRSNAAMVALTDPLSEAYLREIADWFGSLELPYPAPAALPAPAAERAHGQALVLHGDAARGLPACTQCHGQPMTGVQPAVPGLLGLPRDYLVAQLGAWRTGHRRAQAPDCMAQVAQRLSREDIAAVAGWLAAQPVPVDARPAAPSAAALPTPLAIQPAGLPACGSVPR